MLRLDKNDPLDRMILQELGGKPVPFDTWLDAMDELDEEPDCSQILQERGLHMEDVLQEAETYRKDFYAHLSKWELPPDNRYDLCFALLYQAKKTPCLELTRIFVKYCPTLGFCWITYPNQWTNRISRIYTNKSFCNIWISVQPATI